MTRSALPPPELPTPRRMEAGLTLVELMITLTVAVILATVAVPSFTEFIQNNRMISQANMVMGTLTQARSEAVKRAVRVSICPSTDESTCTAGSNWEDGWIMFADDDADGAHDAAETLIRVETALSGSNTLRAESAVFQTYITFKPSGGAAGSASFTSSTFRLCDSRGTAKARTFTINSFGRLRSSTTATACP